MGDILMVYKRFFLSLFASLAGGIAAALLLGFAHSAEGAKIGAALAAAFHDAYGRLEQ